ncbi:MAG: DMT family transporter [Anaerolineales bacterium]|nr:DMT family transporter [Anaerolineales bacterium]
MKTAVLSALVIALASGLAIGTQSTLTNLAGRLLGPTRTGLFINFSGGAIAGIVLLALGLRTTRIPTPPLTGSAVPIVIVAGALGLGIIAGVAFAFPRIGIAAGMATILFGQMLVAVLVDTLGWGGAPPIPLGLNRVVGLGFLVAGALLVLPRG